MPKPKKSGGLELPPTTSITTRYDPKTKGLVNTMLGRGARRETIEARRKHFRTVQKARYSQFKSPQFSVRLGRKKSFLSPGCDPERDFYQSAKDRLPGIRGLRTDVERVWLCKQQNAPSLQFRENNHRVLNQDIRLFIEGAEVTQFIRGPVNWKIETTGGMNSCDFSLNNNHDAFVITPRNICAGLNKRGWRANFRGKDIISQPGRLNRRDNEGAKFLIYRRKYNVVAPGTKNAEIDDSSGMWLYPLSPYRSIISKHDAVRLFIRMPHISGVTRVRRKRTNQHWDLWIPAFTGFVSNYNWEDNPVEGDRVMNVSCYDYRGLMQRMRVRTGGSPLASAGGAKKIGNKIQKGAHPNQNVSFPLLKNEKILNPQEYKSLKKIGALALLAKVQDLEIRLGLQKTCKFRSSSDEGSEKLECAKRIIAAAKKEMVKQANIMKRQFNTINAQLPLLAAAEGRTSVDIGLDARAENVVITFGPKSKKSDLQILLDIQKDIGDGTFKPDSLVNCSTSNQAQQEVGSIAGEGDNRKFYSTQVGRILTDLFIIKCGNRLRKVSGDAFVQFVIDSGIPGAPKSAAGLGRSQANLAFIQLSLKKAGLRSALTRIVASKALTLSPTGRGLPLIGRLFRNAPGGRKFTDMSERNIQLIAKAVAVSIKQLRKSQKITKNAGILNVAYKLLLHKVRTLEGALAAFTGNDETQIRLSNKISNLLKQQNQRRALAKTTNPRVKGSSNIAELILNEPTFTAKQARLFGDLVKDLEQNSHPLAGMSFEMAVKWLVTSQSQIVIGRVEEIGSYNKKGLVEEWNRTVLFGDWGRPLTFDEVTLVGINTNSDTEENPFSPINVYLHFMLPAKGTAAETIVQQDIGANPGNAQSFQYETRKSLLDQICELLDYQWYVTPAGDIAFEFPHYNILPVDFGTQFKNAYVVDKELISNNISEEATDIPTAWVITGMEIDAQAGRAVGDRIPTNLFRKITIMIPTLARRIGVKVEHININLPGVGSVLGPAGRAGGQNALEIWGMFYIQRQIGLQHQVNVKHAFRPYLLPNRPLHLVSRQRIGLIQTVSYSMEPPDGPCTTDTTLGYMRWLFRDGTFRNAAGGLRFPIDYEGFQSGAKTIRLREGVGHSTAVSFRPTTLTPFEVARQTRPKESPKGNTSYGVKGATTGRSQKSVSRTSSQIGGIAQKSRKVSDKTSGSGGTKAQKGATLPAGTAPGRTLKSQNAPSTANLAGRMIQRKPPSNQGRQNLPNYRRTNFTSTGKKNPDHKKKGDGRGDGYDINKLFYDPTPFGKWAGRRNIRDSFNQWGFVRYHSSGLNHQSLHGGRWHAGIDILAPPKSNCHTPIDLTYMWATLAVGRGQGRARYRIKYVTVAIEHINHDTGKRSVSNVQTKYFPFLLGVSSSNLEIDIAAIRGGIPGQKITGGRRKVLSRDSQGRPTRVAVKFLAWIERLEIAKAHGFRIPAYDSHSPRGLAIQGFGRVNIPKGSTDPRFEGDKGKLRCLVRYVHLHSLVSGTETYSKKTRRGYYGIDIQAVRADPNLERPIARLGRSGTSLWHLHFELVILPTRSKDDREPDADYLQAFREVLKVNAEFLTQVLATKLAGKHLRAKPTDKLSPTWKKRLIRKGNLVVPKSETSHRKVKFPVDINNLTALDVAKKLTETTFKRRFQKRTDESKLIRRTKSGKIIRTRAVGTNPLFFFKPGQLVDLRKIRPQMSKTRRNDRYQDTGAGRGRSSTVVHGICKKLTNTGLRSNFRRHFINRAELNRTAGTTATLLGQSQAQRRDAFRRNNQEFKGTEREFLTSVDAVEDHTFDSRVAARLEYESKVTRNSDNRFDEHLEITPTLPNADDYNMFG